MNRREALKRTALLFGIAASPATITRALAEMSAGTTAPRHLTSFQYKVVAAMAERLLPASDTPGAIDAGVPQFIDTAMAPAAQDNMIRAIATENIEPGKEWLRQFRGLTFNGYFTSEAAAKSGFIWDPVPGNASNQTQCIPLAETGGVSFYE